MLISATGVLPWLMWVRGPFVNSCSYFGSKELDDVGDSILSRCRICHSVKLSPLNVGNSLYSSRVVKLTFKSMGGQGS